MERNANYAAVGAFVLLVTLVGVLFVYWYSDARERRNYDRYEIYFAGSVSGLENGAAVRYLGVGVGRVVHMEIDPRDSSRVRVVVDIDSTTPISDQTAAELSLQGVTGLLFIDLLRITDPKQRTIKEPSLKYPVIRSTPSRFDVFLASLPELVAAAGDVVQRADRLLSDRNLNAISTSLAHIGKASESLPQTVQDLNGLIADVRATTRQLQSSLAGAHSVIETAGPELTATLKRLHAVADNLDLATGQLGKVVEDNRKDLRSFTRDGLPEIERFVNEGSAAARDIRELVNSLRQNPSQLLYQPNEKGVEIPR